MKNKGRPKKKKIIQEKPRTDIFSPMDGFGCLEEVILALEEYEAIRLHDHLMLEQKHSAKMMGISQQSFSRLVRNARKKISDAIINAKRIKIEGGHFVNKRSLNIAAKIQQSLFNSESGAAKKDGFYE